MSEQQQPSAGATPVPSEDVPVSSAGTAVAEGQAQESTESVPQNDNVEGSETSSAEEQSEPSVVVANANKGGRETSDKILYVGNLDKTITEDILKQYFQVGGPIANIKIIADKYNDACNYAFIEYHQHHDANIAFETLNGKQIESNVLKINWAFQSQQAASDDTFNLFVGDLNLDVDDETLRSAFNSFPSYMEAHVMWDMLTGRSRGYGFVSFANQEDARNAMETMQGTELNGRPLRINWASKRENNHRRNNNGNNANYRGNGAGGFRPFGNGMDSMNGNGMPPPGPPMGMPVGNVPAPVNAQAVEAMIRRAPPRVTTAYIGNIPHFASEADLIPLLQNFGFILDFKHYPEKGCCFIKYDTHEQAAVCIVALANFPFQGRNLKTGWGKERTTYIPPMPHPQQPLDGSIPVPIPMMGEQLATQQQSPQQ